MAALGGIPVLVLKEGSERVRGRDAQSANINAAKAVASAVRTTLGPKGMDKMLVDSLGDVVITNDGVTILKEMEIESPAAKMVVEVAKTVDEVAGDGTTTSVVLGGELLKKAEELLEQELHPSVITLGYRLAEKKSKEVLDEFAVDLDIENDEELKKIAKTSITGKFAESSRDFLADIAIKAVKLITETSQSGKRVVDTDNISVEKKTGGRVGETMLVQGMALDKEVVHAGMPKRVEDAKIALINASLEVKKTETSAELKITRSDQLKAFLDEEEREMREMAMRIKESGANVVICQKGIDDLVQHYLAKEGIMAVRRAKKSDMEKLAKATGGKVITNLEELNEKDLGHAEFVEERKVGGDKMVFIEGCKNPHAVSIVIRGGTEHVVDEVERALHDMLMVVGSIIEDGKAVAGGGAVETELALRVRAYSASLKGREQLAVEKFAEAMEIIPRTLAENSGLDPIDTLVELKAAHERGEKTAGLDVYSGKIVDMWQRGVIEPLRTKRQVVESATEAAVMILRIDDVIMSKRETLPPGGAGGGGMPPGGGMYGGGGMPPY
ncbi:MAG: thermosome subunit beta [Methanophagales archaeon]|nr:thermosome subunit beta [Methanophagales archaeon]MCW7073200.1 thermosome subunit beta [Methanophagales archaeon]